MKRASLWVDTTDPQPQRPQLDGRVDADVAILGGGIVGVTLAAILAEEGVRVVLVEANQIGRGVTGHTTAKVSSQHGMIYSQLTSKFGAEAARTYGAANESALNWMRERAAGIDCDWRPRTSYAYVPEGEDRGQAEQEADAATQAGLPATLVDATPLPYGVAAAVRFDDQAEFHPAQVPPRPRRGPADLRGLARDHTGQRRGPAGQDPRRPCTGRHGRARHPLPLPGPDAGLRPGAPAALVRAGVPDRRGAAPGDVHLLRLGHPLRARGPPGRRGTTARRRRGPSDGRGRRHRGALRATRGVRPRALDGRVGRVPLVLAGQHHDRPAPLRRRRHSAHRPPPDGHGLRQVGHDRWHGRGDDPRRPDPRTLQSMGGAVRPQPAQPARLGGPGRRGERQGRGALLRRPGDQAGLAADRGPRAR